MKKHSERKNGVILSYANTWVGILVSLIYTPVMLRLLGRSEYGVYNAAASVINYMNLFSLGFNSSYMRFYARYKTAKDRDGICKLNSLFLLVFGIAALLSLISGAILASMPEVVFGTKFTSEELDTSSKLLMIMAFNMALTFIESVFSMYVNAHEKFVFQRLINILSTVIRPAVTLPLLLMGYGSVGLTIASTFVTVGCLAANYICARKNGIGFKFGKPDFMLMREIAVFSFFIFITTVSSIMNETIDKLLLSRYVGASAVAIYEIGEKFNAYFMQFSLMISVVFIPKINMMVADDATNEKLSDLMIRIGRIQFILLAYILGGFALLGRFFISVYAGEGYQESYGISIMLMLASFIPYIQNIGVEIQKAKNKHIFRSIAYMAIAVANVGFSIPCIHRFGISGAAIGTVLALLLGNTVLMNVYYKKGIGLDMSRFWKSMCKPLLSFAAAFLPCFLLTCKIPVSGFGSFFAVGIVFSALYIGLSWFIGMNDYEKALVMEYLPLKKK